MAEITSAVTASSIFRLLRLCERAWTVMAGPRTAILDELFEKVVMEVEGSSFQEAPASALFKFLLQRRTMLPPGIEGKSWREQFLESLWVQWWRKSKETKKWPSTGDVKGRVVRGREKQSGRETEETMPRLHPRERRSQWRFLQGE